MVVIFLRLLPRFNIRYLMKKLSDYFYFNSKKQSDSSENFDNIMVEIIDDVVKKRKVLHDRYNLLFERLWVAEKDLNERKFVARRLLSRLLRESDLIFARAQNLAVRLCPKCQEVSMALPIEKDKLH